MESSKGVDGRAKIDEKRGKPAEERERAKVKGARYGSAGAEESAKNERRAALV